MDHAAVHRAPAPAPHSRLAAEAHGVDPLIRDEAALPQPQVEKPNPMPLRFIPVEGGLIHRAALRTRIHNRTTRCACRKVPCAMKKPRRSQ